MAETAPCDDQYLPEYDDTEINLDVGAPHTFVDYLLDLMKTDKKTTFQDYLKENPDGDYDSLDQNGRKLLGHAVRMGKLDYIELLLKNGCSVNMMDTYRQTPLHYAANYGKLEAAKLLLDKGANVHAIERPCMTPLHAAAGHGSTEIVNLLIEHRADVNVLDFYGISALQCASARNHIDIVKSLVRAGADKNVQNGKQNRSALFLAAERDYRDIVQFLIDSRARINLVDDYGMTPICAMCIQNNTYLAELLLDNGANVKKTDKRKCIPLHYACKNGNETLTKLLLRAESQIDALSKYGETPLHLAARMTHNHIVELLINNGCNVNSYDPEVGVTALFTGVGVYSDKTEFERFLELMIKGGCDINLPSCIRSESGFVSDPLNVSEITPLCKAIDLNKFDLAVLLLQHGADPNILCPHETTILHKACHRKNVELISVLLDCDINWAAEGWLFTNMHTAGINPDILLAEGLDENVPLVLLKNVKLFYAIMDIRFAPQSLKQLCRLEVRRRLSSQLCLKVDKLFLPPSLAAFIMMKVN